MTNPPHNNNLNDHGTRIPRSGRRSDKASQVASMRNPCAKFRIGTWNVKTLLKTGKVEELKQEMKRAELDILGICETRWAGNGDFTSE